ncbi:MAG: cation:proton antiporter regulatory subunit [Thermoplasmatota archaeon]
MDPYIAEFLDKVTLAQDIEITHIKVPSDSNIVGRKLKNSKIREKTGTTVIGIRKGDEFIPNPGSDVLIKPNDRLIVIGKIDNIHKLNRYVKM